MKEPVFVDAEEHISRAVGGISRSGIEAVVLKDGKYCGLISDRTLRQHKMDGSKAKCGALAEKAPNLTPESSLLDICNAFFTTKFRAIPVVEKSKVIGMLTRADVIKALIEERLIPKKAVSEVMTSPAVTIDEAATISRAKDMMKRNNVRRLVVTKEGMLEGIISTFDLATLTTTQTGGHGMERSAGQTYHAENSPVSSFMRQNIETIEPTEALVEAARRMAESQISALVVSDGLKPIGVITARDIFETAMKIDEEQDVYISGLDGEDKALYKDIEKETDRELSKFRKSFSISSISLHVKKHGNKYSIRARVHHGAGAVISLSAHDWDVFTTLRKVLSETKRALLKTKVIGMHKMHHKRA